MEQEAKKRDSLATWEEPESGGTGAGEAHLPAKVPRRECGDARDLSFLDLRAKSIDLVVTSPPYWRRRDYGHANQLGQEPTPGKYIKALVKALNGWAKLLRAHGSVFLNIGDTYSGG